MKESQLDPSAIPNQVRSAHLHIAACLAGAQGQPVRSARLWGAAEALREEIGTILSPVEHHVYGPYIDAAKPALLVRRTLTRGEDGRGWVVGTSSGYAVHRLPSRLKPLH